MRADRRVRALQERAARATPAAVSQVRDGVWLRHTDSAVTWWAGAALVHRAAAPAVGRTIDAAERFYAEHGAPARFQVCPACPPTLDAALASRGYARSGAMSLQTARTGQVRRLAAAPPLRTTVRAQPDEHWWRVWSAVQGSGSESAGERRALAQIGRPCAYATAFRAGRPVAVGRSVADGGWVGVFAMATLPEARGRGAARAVLAALADRSLGSRLYLQVERTSPAVRLYRRAGLRELARYHYRCTDEPGPVAHA